MSGIIIIVGLKQNISFIYFYFWRMQMGDPNQKSRPYQSLRVTMDFRRKEKSAEQEHAKSLKPHRGNNLKDFKGCFHKPLGTPMEHID